ncbi:MAG: transcription termination/antitermination NusG family protein [Candidatus Latescibacterota bacterium]
MLTPEEQADHLFRPAEDGGLWYVLHCRPRCEKRAAGACAEHQVRSYLPVHRKVHPPRKGQRGYAFDIPLFTGYLFACCTPMGRYQLLRSELLVRTIEVVDQAGLLAELRSVYLACCSQVSLTLYPQLRRGRRVRVTAGPLRGIVGRISQRKQGFRLVVNVTILGQGVAMEVDMDQVELLGG